MFVTTSVPPSVKVPVIFAALFVNGECRTCMNVVLPAASVRLLLTVNVPSPAAAEPLKLPLTSNVPLLNTVVPVCVLAPVNVHVPVPSLVSATIPWNDAALVASVFNPPTRHVTAFFPPRPLAPSALTVAPSTPENSPMGMALPDGAREYMETFAPIFSFAFGKPFALATRKSSIVEPPLPYVTLILPVKALQLPETSPRTYLTCKFNVPPPESAPASPGVRNRWGT